MFTIARVPLSEVMDIKINNFDIDEDFLLDFKELENEISDICFQGELKEMLKHQLSEIEMLQSMFSNPGEFCLDDFEIIADMNNFVEGKASIIPPNLDFTINLVIENTKFSIYVTLPHEYPACEPEIFVRSDKFTRYQQYKLNEDLTFYISSLDRGEICVGSAIYWLQEHAPNYITQELESQSESSSYKEKNDFARYWIYSHHIYSKVKRREILALAEDYSLTGFSLPGRPGVICIEGAATDCSNCWQRIKSMTWKKIGCRKKEIITNTEEISVHRKFKSFNELSFQSQNLTSKHMDMGELYKFLEKHECAYAFRDYFGVDGKST